MNNRILSLAVVCLIFCLCQACETRQPSIIGTWQNTSLTVNMKLPNGKDSVMSVPDGQWEEIMNFKPIQTTFIEDGTFTSKYISLDGELLGTEEGTWLMRNDSLILKSAGYDYAYHVSYEGDKSRFVSLLDFNKDGTIDLYDGWQIRMKEN